MSAPANVVELKPGFYQAGRYVGPTGHAQDVHIAIRGAVSAEDRDELLRHLGMLEALAEDDQTLTLAVVEQYPLGMTQAREHADEIRGELRAVVRGELKADKTTTMATGRKLATMAEFIARNARPKPALAKGAILRGSYVVVYGGPGEGKSYVCQDFAHSVADPKRAYWHKPEFKLHHGPVLYLAYEGGAGLTNRLKALEDAHGAPADLHVVTDCSRYALCDVAGLAALCADLAATFSARMPVLIVIDTVAKVLGLSGLDENAAKDVGRFNVAIEGLIRSTGATVLGIHHSGKNPNLGARGSNALLAAVDTEIEIAGKQATATKQRDLPERLLFGFKLDPRPVGLDDEGDPIMACTVSAAEAGPREAKLPPQVQTALQALVEVAPNGEPVDRDVWREAFVRREWPDDPPEANTLKQAWKRVTKVLVDSGRTAKAADGKWQLRLRGAEDFSTSGAGN